jgi:glycosyltransferase involved in cell wall biosynthesis
MVAQSAYKGGAARGMRRVVETLRAELPREQLEVVHRVAKPRAGRHVDDDLLIDGLPRGSASWRREASGYVDRIRAARRSKTPRRSKLSTAQVWTGLGDELERSNVDIVTLGLLASSTISIEEIGRLSKPIVWNLSDMWAFSGAEHISDTGRFIEGYRADNRPSGESGWDLNRATWERKHRSWQRPQWVVTPSNWLADCVRSSALMHDWPTTVIPRPLDLTFWRPATPLDVADDACLDAIDPTRPVLLFVAAGGTKSRNKGFALLEAALGTLATDAHASADVEALQVVVAGGTQPSRWMCNGFPVHEVGDVADDVTLRRLYHRATLTVVPSRIDNFPQTATESQACGVPVVAFRVGGLVDIVDDHVTGRLAEPFDTAGLADAIRWTLTQGADRSQQLRASARARMVRMLSPSTIAQAYFGLFTDIMSAGSRRDFGLSAQRPTQR